MDALSNRYGPSVCSAHLVTGGGCGYDVRGVPTRYTGVRGIGGACGGKTVVDGNAKLAAHLQCAGEPPFPVYIQYRYGTVDFWIMYKNLQIHAMRATFHIVFSVRI